MAVAATAVTSARATIFTGSYDVVYSDTFAAPASNVNAASSDPNAIIGNAPAVATGLDGGSASATYIGYPVVTSTSGTPDADWQYSGSNSATITSPSANLSGGEDTKTITNLTLPIVPVVGYAYDLEMTMALPSATGGHGLEMAFLYNSGNAHNTLAQAISNNDPVGLILDRDALSNGNYFEIFEGLGTASDNSFSPSASALTGGAVGTTVTVDSIFTPTGTTTGTMSWYLNGVLVNATPVSETGLTGGVSFIQFGDNRTTGGSFSNFSLTAQAVPEPASLGVAAVGALALVARRRR
ncbi:MAG TPA: PEP-CTERM sorting domain-containing protein [Phycisphaerae bacterium]|nr:PEP-CTERM sorting domain-containing protein [Phycisphaerae bacterium]